MKYYVGSGFINSAINALPFELHLPGGYRYCGPGTKLQKRLTRGDKPINELDAACMQHDIAYSQQKDLIKRHEADNILRNAAMNRVKSSDASIGEKAAALGVAGIMKAKVKLGMGLKRNNSNCNCNKIWKKHLKLVDKIKKTVDNAYQAINDTFKKNTINIDNKEVLRRVPKRNKKLSVSTTRNKKSLVSTPNNNEILNAAMLDVINKRKRNDNVTTIKPQHFLKRKHSIELDDTINKKQKFEEDNRVIPVPKKGGILPLIPIFAGLSALGALSGGAAAIAKAVNQANQAKKQLSEAERHNKTMESIAMGKGLYLKPYKKGLGLYLNEIEAHHEPPIPLRNRPDVKSKDDGAVIIYGRAKALCEALKQVDGFEEIIDIHPALNLISQAIIQKNFQPEFKTTIKPGIEPEIPDDERILYIPNQPQLASYMLQWLAEKIKNVSQTPSPQFVYPPFVTSETLLNAVIEDHYLSSLITSFYFCCLLTVSSGQMAGKIISELQWLADTRANIVFVEEYLTTLEPIIKNFTYFDNWSMEKLIDAAFFGICGIAKKQTKFEFIRDWVNKRLPALHTSCKMRGSKTLPSTTLQFDIPIPADFFATYVEIRRAVYVPLLTGDIDEEGSITTGFSNQARMILSNTEMTTFELTYRFAEDCETEVHLLEPIIDQCKKVIELREELKETSIEEGIEYSYYYFYTNLPSTIQISNFPDLAYAAIQRRRKESDTFKQYADIKHDNGQITSKVIDSLLGKPLLESDTNTAVSQKVLDFITKKGKKANVVQPTEDVINDLIRKLTAAGIN
ncbi:Borna disease virus P40 protein [Popillia japonica]|uniref:Borna disease virus P40 protein n=1 Tax=Popillia japonica TaxID=7064 RepID=A0AAW1MEF0_POPJA